MILMDIAHDENQWEADALWNTMQDSKFLE